MPSVKDRYLKNAHVTIWHVDEREDAGVPQSQGVAFGANWTFNKKLMPFFRAGWSDGAAPLMNKSATVGLIHRFHKSDLAELVLTGAIHPMIHCRISIHASCFTGSSFLKILHSLLRPSGLLTHH